VLSEDVEDQPGAVDDLHLHDVFELYQLTWRQLAVTDHRVGGVLDHDVAKLASLSRSDVRSWVWLVTTLHDAVKDQRTSGLGERSELAKRDLGVTDGALCPHPDQHNAFEPDLPVLDLGDVLELSGKTSDAAKR
jgi:hypothetical protein